MGTPRDRYPQQWPDYLSLDVDVGSCTDIPPTGEHLLLLEKLNYFQFEQLCWWLLQKDHSIVGCQMIGGKGRGQGGIDLFAYDKLRPQNLVVFECKCWVDLEPAELSRAITRFLGGDWVKETSRFVLIVAQPTTEKISAAWHEGRKKLREAGIESELWTGLHLTQRLQQSPGIVTKFFLGAPIETFCNDWMRREEFLERLHRALVDPREEVAGLARDFVADTPTEDIEQRVSGHGMWKIERPWVCINAILPSTRFAAGSASIILKRADVEGATVVLTQEWLFRKFLGSVGAPLTEQYRPFIVGQLPGSSSDKFVVDLENCRFSVQRDYVGELSYVADELTKDFVTALHELEATWGARHFPFTGNSSALVAICVMPNWLWRTIIEFAQEHDFTEGETEWHMFDAASGLLKPYTDHANARYERGHHAILHPRQLGGFLHPNEDVAVFWSPPDSLGDGINLKRWWPCDYTLKWIQDELLPAVGDWAMSKRKKSLFARSRRAEFMHWWNDNAKIRDLRSWPLAQDERYARLGLVRTAEELQRFFHSQVRQKGIYMSAEHMMKLYAVMILLLKGGRGYTGYLSGSLSISDHCETHAEIVEQLQHRIENESLTCNSTLLDHLLRAMLEALGDDDSWLNRDYASRIFEALLPLMKFHDQEILFTRHSNDSLSGV